MDDKKAGDKRQFHAADDRINHEQCMPFVKNGLYKTN